MTLLFSFCRGRKEDSSSSLTQTFTPTYCTQTSQTHPLHDQPPIPKPGLCPCQTALCGGPADQLSPLFSPFQLTQSTQCQAHQPVLSEPTHPSHPHYTTDSGHSQPDPAPRQAPSIVHWQRVYGQWAGGWRCDGAGCHDNTGPLRGPPGASEVGGDQCIAGRGAEGCGGQDTASGRVSNRCVFFNAPSELTKHQQLHVQSAQMVIQKQLHGGQQLDEAGFLFYLPVVSKN